MCQCIFLTDAEHQFLTLLSGRCSGECASSLVQHTAHFSCVSFVDSDCSYYIPGANGNTSCRLLKHSHVAGLAPKRSPGKGVKRRREVGRPAAPTKAVQAKKQRMLEAPAPAARPIARLAAHSRHEFLLAQHKHPLVTSSRNTSMQCSAMLFHKHVVKCHAVLWKPNKSRRQAVPVINCM